MKILFPSLPAKLTKVDFDFAGEFAAAQAARCSCLLFDHGLVVRGELEQALCKVPDANGEPVVHRSWMLTGEQYASLFEALVSKGYQPLVTPAAYEQSHYLPLAYPLIEQETARSIWNESGLVHDAWELYSRLAGRDALLKDWVKSAKYRWKDGCFLPAGTSREQFEKIFAVFREERGQLFNRGVVIREYLDFRREGSDMRGFPIIEETRLLFWRGKVLIEPTLAEIRRDLHRWERVASRFQSPFISLDIAPLDDGTFKIVETGDGGVSGLPATLDPEQVYREIQRREAEHYHPARAP